MAHTTLYKIDEPITTLTRPDKTAAEIAAELDETDSWTVIARPDGRYTAILIGGSWHATIED